MATERPKDEKVSATPIPPTGPAVPAPKTDPLAVAFQKYKETVESSTYDRIMGVTRDQLRRPDQDTHIRKGNVKGSRVWTVGPGGFFFLAEADDRFAALAKFMKVKRVNGKVARVHAFFADETQILVMYPADPDDLNALEVKRSGSGAYVNLSNVMIAEGIAVETGYKELRNVSFIPETSPLAPGLMVDFNLAPLVRKVARKAKDGEEIVEEEEGEETEETKG